MLKTNQTFKMELNLSAMLQRLCSYDHMALYKLDYYYLLSQSTNHSNFFNVG